MPNLTIRTPLDKDDSQEPQSELSNVFLKKEEKKKKLFKRKKTMDNPISSERRVIKDMSYSQRSRSGISFVRGDNNEESHAQNEKEIYKYLHRIMKNDLRSLLCISGRAFSYLVNKNKQIQEEEKMTDRIVPIFKRDTFDYAGMLNLIDSKGRIFYRMSPNDKVDLVNFFKENPKSIVAMCGDGANDCGALLSADVGISICHRDGSHSITSHFYSSEESISCVELIIRNGRACYENSIILFKYMILYAVIQLTSVLLLFGHKKDFSNLQYLFLDCFLTLISCLLANK
jgi:magnesium-transporting ATPase (P-type)